ncbi:tyrosine-type recombinase/integrase [Mycolicibacterium setense]|uniref:tyrosine-type recombinase/integrase n=1 Tax=Mycolicibacterium setense TaxID=431269 RepID=UPI0005741BFE|nr:tyrosine-type recombinase/integrase [Mycolicibacterium setense]KHO18654.1 integrase [Mycolicibacterium setense]MCV7111338.1 site-specific integrase [Mycolicibacterium setense]
MATISRYETSSGATRYRVRYRTPDRRQTDKRGFKTKRDAEAFAATVEVEKLTGSYVAPALGKVTVGELGPEWLARQKAIIKPSAFHSVESAWRVHVEPRWASKAIADINFSEVQSWVAELAGRRKGTVVRTAYDVLARILDDAVKDRRLARNAARGVKLPARSKRKNIYLTAEQLQALAVEAGRYRSLVLLLGMAGLRWGEAAALRVGDIDFLKRRVVLHENAVTVGADVHLGTLKSGKERTVVLPEFVVDELAKTCRGKQHGDLIWPAREGGHLGPPSSHDSWLSGAVERCQTAATAARANESKRGKEPTTPVFPRVTAHALRHTAASLAISAGANVKVVQRMLGHSSAAMTLDVYADLFDDDLTGVADKLDETVGKMWAKRTQAAV